MTTGVKLTRIAALPDVPTLREAGVPLEIYAWSCVFTRAATPQAVVGKLRMALTKALADPKLDEAIVAGGGERFSPPPEQVTRFLADERTLWGISSAAVTSAPTDLPP
ncbi:MULTISPECIES: tripartite tricarboxylate transporter substrate-binding protein [Cupriavidus]|uniref:tripartite tricarboxylate transporter substrate-binding protein n=1 Tax=Cupriavidus TaxID=106589 RepID=UPI001CB970FA|nr:MULTISPECIES: tripartite tricarboxylate transporter substrate-binding protein [Cupriavidus]